jgi:chromosome partitioning protein
MKTISTMMMKGGSGKTTLTRILASAALAQDMKVHIFDVDTDPQALGWEASFNRASWGKIEKPDWRHDQLTISGAVADMDEIYDGYDRMEAEGYDLVLTDTRPGANADTEDLILATDLVLIPTRPEQSDFTVAERTVEWFDDILKTVTPDSPTPALRTVLTAVPNKMISVLTGDLDIDSLTPRDRDALQAVMNMPHVLTVIPNSKYWREIPAWGPLGVAADAASRQPAGRLQGGAMHDVLAGGEALLEELFAVIDARNTPQ